MKLFFINILCSFPFAVYSQTLSSYSHILGDSASCQIRREKLERRKDCGSKDPFEDSKEMAQHTLAVQTEDFSQDLKSDYFFKIKRSLISQFQSAAWLSRSNPLNGKEGKYLKEKIEAASQKCKGESAAQLNEIKAEIESMDPLKELQTVKVDQKTLEKSLEFYHKRMLIAWIEVSRLERFINRRLMKTKERDQLKERLKNLRASYPLLVNSNDEYLLNQITKEGYGRSLDLEKVDSHPQIDQILFPNKEGQFANVLPGAKLTDDNEGLVNLVLKNPLSEAAKGRIHSHIARSMAKGFESVGLFCEMTPCQTMQLNLNSTAEKIEEVPSQREIRTDVACTCNLASSTEYVRGSTQLFMVGGAIGGLVLCPVTFGIGCYGSAAAGAGLALSSAANTYGAIKDHLQLSPVVKTALSLPGLSEAERMQIQENNKEISRRIVRNAMGTVIGGGPGVHLLKKGKKMFSNPENFRPIPVQVVDGENLMKSSASQMKELEFAGAQFEKDRGMTYVEAGVKFSPDVIKYQKGSLTQEYFGEMLKIKKLPRSTKKARLNANAFTHPDMPEYLKKMKELGTELVVDTSLTETKVAAYFDGETKVIGLRPDSTWQDFLHEFQHAQFNAFIEPRLERLQISVQAAGASLKELLPNHVLTQYGPKEIKRLEKLIKQEYPSIGINESMSTSRELDALGWKQYLPNGGRGPRLYGANHRVNSLLELKEQGYELSDRQIKSLLKGRTEVVLAHAYDYVGPVAAASSAATPVVIKTSANGGYEIIHNIKIFFNEKTGETLTSLPEGKIIRMNLAEPSNE